MGRNNWLFILPIFTLFFSIFEIAITAPNDKNIAKLEENEQSKICLGCGSEVMNGESEDEEIEEKMQRCCLCLEYGPESEMAYVDPNLEHEGQSKYHKECGSIVKSQQILRPLGKTDKKRCPNCKEKTFQIENKGPFVEMEILLKELTTKRASELKKVGGNVLKLATKDGLLDMTKKNYYLRESRLSLMLLPSRFPRQIFQQAIDVQKAISLLYFRVSSDIEFLATAFDDDYMRNSIEQKFLAKMREATYGGKIRQPIGLLLQETVYACNVNPRSAINEPQYELRQVEVIAGSESILIGELVTDFHQKMLEEMGLSTKLPANRQFGPTAEALYRAWQAFGNSEAIIVFIHQKHLDNQRYERLSQELKQISEGKVKIEHIKNVGEHGRLSLAEDHSLLLDKLYTVGLVFNPTIFSLLEDSYEHVDLFGLIELSTAIKCPSIGMILASEYRVQRLLSRSGMVERFFPDQSEAQMIHAIRATLPRSWDLGQDNAETREAFWYAHAHPEHFEMRSPGGHYVSHFSIKHALEKLDKKGEYSGVKKAKWTLTESVYSMANKNLLIAAPNEAPELIYVNSELTTFNFLLGNSDDGQILYQGRAGHLLRTKSAKEKYKNYEKFDSPYLI